MNHTEKRKYRKLFIIAGEASGDLYGGQLAKELLRLDPHLEIKGWGGEAMASAGVSISTHYKDLAFMGFWEVLKNIRTIHHNLQRCKEEIIQFQPDAFVGIDFPGFNLRVSAHLKEAGIFTHHYISPSIWAWNARRIHRIKRSVNRMHVAMKFELPAYQAVQMDARFVGHPLVSLLKEITDTNPPLVSPLPILALLPGSRTQEIKHLLPVMVETAKSMPEFQAVIAGAPGQDPNAYSLAKEAGIPVLFNQTRQIMRISTVGLITSGTATLEASLLELPQVICYRTSRLTYHLAKLLSQVEWIGLPNILLNRLAVPERIQAECNPIKLQNDIKALFNGDLLTPAGEQQRQLASSLKTLLGAESAAKNTAASIMEKL